MYEGMVRKVKRLVSKIQRRKKKKTEKNELIHNIKYWSKAITIMEYFRIRQFV